MTKQVNYTDEMVARLHEVYDPEATDEVRDEQVAQLSAELERNPASIRAKLTREGVYVPKTKAEAGKGGVRKAQLVQTIADALEVDVDVVGSLEKATKVALNHVAKALKA